MKQFLKFLIPLGIIMALAMITGLDLDQAAAAYLYDDEDRNFVVVPGGDLVALYDAVYDETAQPRDDVEIVLEAGDFTLDPTQPFGGRLVLGHKTILRSTLEMALDENGVPIIGTDGQPVILTKGARIDGGALTPHYFGEGAVMVGHQGLVANVWVDGAPTPGIENVYRGVVRHVLSTNNTVGIRVRAAEMKSSGRIEESFVAGNIGYDVGVVALDPDLGHPTGESVQAKAYFERNAIVGDGFVNVLIHGGLGTDGSKTIAHLTNNMIIGQSSLASVRVVGGFDLQSHGGANANVVKAIIRGNTIDGAEVGLLVEGTHLNDGFLSDPSLPLAERQSTDNEVTVTLDGNNFQGFGSYDILLYGSHTRTGEPGGDNNKVEARVDDGTADLLVGVFDCYPEDAFSSCTSEAEISFDDDDDDDDGGDDD